MADAEYKYYSIRSFYHPKLVMTKKVDSGYVDSNGEVIVRYKTQDGAMYVSGYETLELAKEALKLGLKHHRDNILREVHELSEQVIKLDRAEELIDRSPEKIEIISTVESTVYPLFNLGASINTR